MKVYKQYIVIIISFFAMSESYAVSGVNPSGVNVSHTGSSTVFLTFQNLDSSESSTDAFWCGDVTTTAVSATNPCVSGTIFGHLPKKLNRSQNSTAGAFTNFTDIMTIPASVTRRAFQAARNGANSDFFYVRQFTGGDFGSRFVTVTCRLAGGGARSPLALLDVKVGFLNDKGAKSPIFLVERDTTPSKIAATILYNGTGRLKGRWEVKYPGDPEPTSSDLLTEATLPIEKRGLQRRYTVLNTFDIFLSPTGKVILPGPKANKIPHNVDGLYKILLRIEATRDKEGNSNTGAGIVASGGVAGFPMPVLRYYVGSRKKLKTIEDTIHVNDLHLMLPQDETSLDVNKAYEFSWVGVKDASIYLLEIFSDDILIASATLKAGQESYMAPPHYFKNINKTLKWSVKALDNEGAVLAKSSTRSIITKSKK